jgi:hypothetical protein
MELHQRLRVPTSQHCESVSTQKLVLPPHLSKYLFRSSFLAIISVIAAVHNQRLDCLICALPLWLTSVNYWRHPTHGLRRHMDIATACSTCVYQLYIALEAPGSAPTVYFMAVACGMGCYANARCSAPRSFIGCMWHLGLHLWGNIASVLLYDALGHNYLKWGPSSIAFS